MRIEIRQRSPFAPDDDEVALLLKSTVSVTYTEHRVFLNGSSQSMTISVRGTPNTVVEVQETVVSSVPFRINDAAVEVELTVVAEEVVANVVFIATANRNVFSRLFVFRIIADPSVIDVVVLLSTKVGVPYAGLNGMQVLFTRARVDKQVQRCASDEDELVDDDDDDDVLLFNTEAVVCHIEPSGQTEHDDRRSWLPKLF